MTAAVAGQDSIARAQLVARGLALERITIGWNVLEAVLAIATGLAARSIALTGFGADSIVEVIAAAALLARLRAEAQGRGAVGEKGAMRINNSRVRREEVGPRCLGGGLAVSVRATAGERSAVDLG